MRKRKVSLDQIENVSIPGWVLCEVEGCGWCIPNERGSFPAYCEHLRTEHVDGSPVER